MDRRDAVSIYCNALLSSANKSCDVLHRRCIVTRRFTNIVEGSSSTNFWCSPHEDSKTESEAVYRKLMPEVRSICRDK